MDIVLNMQNKSWKTIKSEIFKQTPWTTFMHNEFEMPNGKKGDYYFVHSKGSSIIIPVTSDNKVILIRQYRYLIDEESWEFPGGGVKDDQNYEDAALAELKEETGYIAKKIQYIGEFVPMNGVTDEKCKVFLATGLEKGEKRLEETEEGMEIAEVAISELEEMIKNNTIKDGQALAGWQLARKYIC